MKPVTGVQRLALKKRSNCWRSSATAAWLSPRPARNWLRTSHLPNPLRFATRNAANRLFSETLKRSEGSLSSRERFSKCHSDPELAEGEESAALHPYLLPINASGADPSPFEFAVTLS